MIHHQINGEESNLLTQSQRSKLRISLILLIAAAAVFAVCAVLSRILGATGAFGLHEAAVLLAIAAAAALTAWSGYMALRKTEQGKKLPAVVFVSVFAVLMFTQAWYYFAGFVRQNSEWLNLVGAVGYLTEAAVVAIFYAYAYTARRAKSLGLWIAALITAVISAVCLTTWTVVELIDAIRQFDTLTADTGLAGILLLVGELVLNVGVLAGIAVGMRKVSGEAPTAVPDMFSVLSLYRKSLRKERD